jgi:hypothetical protein
MTILPQKGLYLKLNIHLNIWKIEFSNYLLQGALPFTYKAHVHVELFYLKDVLRLAIN